MIICGDCLGWMRQQPDKSIDLVFGSPPYEAARTYGIGFNLKGQEWVDWMVERWVEMDRICRGLVAMVVEGQTRKFQWSATPALLMADLHRREIKLRKPPAYARAGIPGSGGPDWLANRYEFIVCSSHGKLPWSDNTAMGTPPKYGPGGVPSHRMTNGERATEARMRQLLSENPGMSQREAARLVRLPFKHTTSGVGNEGTMTQMTYVPPRIANPGNIIECAVGGGKMGSDIAHEGEAAFHPRVAEFFVRSFCPPGGVVLDPFSGTGTTASEAVRHGRRYIAIDIRQSQCDLTARRLQEVQAA